MRRFDAIAGRGSAGYGGAVPDVDALVLNTVNASWKRAIGAAELAACLAGDGAIASWEHHLRTFFVEVPLEAMLRFMIAHDIGPADAYAVYRRLMAHERIDERVDTWLRDLAAASG
jgi:hypothetical protein